MSNNLSVEEVMYKIKDYVTQQNKVNQQDNVNDSIQKFDSLNIYNLDELAKHKNNNNYIYEIKSEFILRSNRKFIGKVIIRSKKLIRKVLRWLINPIINQINEFNVSVTKSINEIHNVLDYQRTLFSTMNQSINEIKNTQIITTNNFNQNMEELKLRISNCESCVILLKEELGEKLDKLKNVDSKLQKLDIFEEKLSRFENRDNDSQTEVINNLNRELTDVSLQLKTNIEERDFEYNYLSTRVRRLENILKKEKGFSTNVCSSENKTNIIDSNAFDYFLFENRFRGSEKEIRERQIIYANLFKENNNVLDIGCGRGELLEILCNKGINAKGIEINEDFVQHCIDKELEVECIDAVSYLINVEDNSLDGIIMAQVVEHIAYDEVLQILKLSYNKLKKNGKLVIETPNPQNLSTFTNAFYVDPYHVKPIHPETLKFSLSCEGFKNIKVEHFGYSKVDYSIPLLEGENIHNLLQFNNSINVLNDLIFGYQDYTIIASK